MVNRTEEKGLLLDRLNNVKHDIENGEIDVEKLSIDRLFKTITKGLKRKPNKEAGVWYDGEEILFDDEETANTCADLIDAIYNDNGDCVYSSTGYYDPEEDEADGLVDDHTGWHYVNVE